VTAAEPVIRAERFLEKWAGFGQLLFTILGWASIVVWNARGLSDQAEQQAATNRILAAQFAQISDKVLQLSLSTERMAEHASVVDRDTDRRLERLERATDGHK
jgi:hypothetical protein